MTTVPTLIDLRSDTVTKPTEAMRRAMHEAVVGDDVYSEDPTVNCLQDMAAELTGCEAALLMPTGTMSNQAAIAVHTVRGQEVISPQGAHIYEYEPGAMAVISGVLPRLVPAPLGVPSLADIQGAIRNNRHQAPTGLITLENSHNAAGGTVVPLEHCHAVSELAKRYTLPLHLDGARLCNAATALGVSLADACAPFDSVSICLSKGLGAPAGTVLVGSRDFIDEAHRYRKMLGGGMRQAGVLAAAAIIGFTEIYPTLHHDHERAKRLAHAIATLPGLSVDLASVQTNMIYFGVDDPQKVTTDLETHGILCAPASKTSIRMVVHHQITDDDITTTINALTRVSEAALRA